MIILSKAKAKTNRAVETENQDANDSVKISNFLGFFFFFWDLNGLFPETGIMQKILSDFLFYVIIELICRMSKAAFSNQHTWIMEFQTCM